MTWRKFFENVRETNQEISYDRRAFQIQAVGDEMVELGHGEEKEFLSYGSILRVGSYKENRGSFVIYTIASSDDLESLERSIVEMNGT